MSKFCVQLASFGSLSRLNLALGRLAYFGGGSSYLHTVAGLDLGAGLKPSK